MTPAAELHAAAARVRQLVDALNPLDRAHRWRVVVTDTENETGVATGPTDDDTTIEAWLPPLAAYIATMDHLVGHALADLLEDVARVLDRQRWHDSDEHLARRELAVARAILGTDQDAGRSA